MSPLIVIILSLAGLALALLLAFQIGFRILRMVHPRPCPWQVAGILENPLRHRFMSPQKTMDRIGLSEGMTVLELGPGPGFLTAEAARRVGSSGKLYSLDIQIQMLDKVKRKLRRNGVDSAGLILGDATTLPFQDNSLDLAFLVYVLGEIPDGDTALRELNHVLKPGGVLSIAEVLFDPDYTTKASLIKRGRQAGFEPFEHKGNFLHYTVNLRKPYN